MFPMLASKNPKRSSTSAGRETNKADLTDCLQDIITNRWPKLADLAIALEIPKGSRRFEL
jgi:hypothetical protein